MLAASSGEDCELFEQSGKICSEAPNCCESFYTCCNSTTTRTGQTTNAFCYRKKEQSSAVDYGGLGFSVLMIKVAKAWFKIVVGSELPLVWVILLLLLEGS